MYLIFIQNGLNCVFEYICVAFVKTRTDVRPIQQKCLQGLHVQGIKHLKKVGTSQNCWQIWSEFHNVHVLLQNPHNTVT